REPAFAEGGVILPGHEDLSRIGAHLLAPLIVRGGLDGHDAPVALSRLPQLEHAAPRIQGVADEGGLLVLERVHLEIGDGPSRDIGHRHADDHAVHERPKDHPLLVLSIRLRVMGVRVQRMLVHGEESEPGAVRFGDGAARPVPEGLTDREFFKVASVAHGTPTFRWTLATAWRAMALRKSPFPA